MSRSSAIKKIKENDLSLEDYLRFEEKSAARHEYMDGEIFLMAGSRRFHSLTSNNIARHLGNQLEAQPCEVHQGDFRVRVRELHYVYPDVVVACDIKLVAGIFDTLDNPQIIFEVLSKSTEKRDKVDKLRDYLEVGSLADYVLISQKEMLVEHYTRRSETEWIYQKYERPEQKIIFTSINCELTLEQIYQKVQFPAELKIVRKKVK